VVVVLVVEIEPVASIEFSLAGTEQRWHQTAILETVAAAVAVLQLGRVMDIDEVSVRAWCSKLKSNWFSGLQEKKRKKEKGATSAKAVRLFFKKNAKVLLNFIFSINF
jgi:hypothetical protein